MLKKVVENVVDYLLTVILGVSILFILMVPNLFFVGIIGFFIILGIILARIEK